MTRPTIAFTSGCFDLLHDGHRHLLWIMQGLADVIHVAVNSDDYVRRRKGREPIHSAQERMASLRSTGLVDELSCFDEDGPLALILRIRPDYIVVGDDYAMDQIVGAKECEEWDGVVVRVPRLPGISTTEILAARARDPLAEDRKRAMEYLRGDRDEELFTQS